MWPAKANANSCHGGLGALEVVLQNVSQDIRSDHHCKV